jgi:6-pyruvoyltetrahydropterin/6-carboxytetrahydropterin synthase
VRGSTDSEPLIGAHRRAAGSIAISSPHTDVSELRTMFTVAVSRDFVAQHVLTAGSGGPEHAWHSHSYRLEVRLEGGSLDERGYLVDIAEVEAQVDALVARYRDRTLNDLPELAGLNPSVEHVARVSCEALAAQLGAPNLQALTVRLWENAGAWAAYRLERPPAGSSKGVTP